MCPPKAPFQWWYHRPEIPKEGKKTELTGLNPKSAQPWLVFWCDVSAVLSVPSALSMILLKETQGREPKQVGNAPLFLRKTGRNGNSALQLWFIVLTLWWVRTKGLPVPIGLS